MIDLRRLPSFNLCRIGVTAFAKGDRATAVVCLRLLEPRRTREAAKEAAKLRKLLLLSTASNAPKAKASGGVEGVFIDEKIEPHRERLILSARKSIWLSSLTFPCARLVDLLVRMARDGVTVVLVVAARKIQGRRQKARLDRLERAGVDCRCLRATHSKLLIVDEELVMIGSANAHGVWRDACRIDRDRRSARELINYLERLSAEERPSPSRRH